MGKKRIIVAGGLSRRWDNYNTCQAALTAPATASLARSTPVPSGMKRLGPKLGRGKEGSKLMEAGGRAVFLKAGELFIGMVLAGVGFAMLGSIVRD